MPEYKLMRGLKADIRLCGLEPLMCPMPQLVSSQRLNMFCNNLVQALVVEGTEIPQIMSGYESNFGEYEQGPKIKQDSVVLGCIPKYNPKVGVNPIQSSPSYIVVLHGLDTNEIYYIEVSDYTVCGQGHGYKNKINNTALYANMLSKGERITTSPNHHGENGYSYGVNVNIAYGSWDQVTEDAFVISESLAKRLTPKRVETLNITVHPSQTLLNLYGTVDDYKICPDIGEPVRSDGIILGLRDAPTDATILSDLSPVALATPYHLHDELFKAPPGATIVDIQFHTGDRYSPSESTAQIDKYQESYFNHQKKLCNLYESILKDYPNAKISPEFNTLIHEAQLGVARKDSKHKLPGVSRISRRMKIKDKNAPIPYLNIQITYTYQLPVRNGFKLTGRDGSKGVVSAVWPDECMPVDEQGFKADMLMDAQSVVNRLNPSQFYETFITRTAEFVRRDIEVLAKQGKYQEALDGMLEFCDMINPAHGELVRECVQTATDCEEAVIETVENNIKLFIPPFLETIGRPLVKKLLERYNSGPSCITFKLPNDDNTVLKEIKTKRPVLIGSKYVMLLYKYPVPKSSAITHINKLQTPVKPNTRQKQQSAISNTPVRSGVDEGRIFVLGCNNSKVIARWYALQANSSEGVRTMVEEIMTADHPTRIDRFNISDEQLRKTNNMIGTTYHIFSTLGIDLTDTEVTLGDD